MILLQLVLFCAVFILTVRIAAGGNAANVLFWYPKEFQETAYARGIADRDAVQRRRKISLTVMMLVIVLALLAILGLCNRAFAFKEAYLQSLLFLEVMNWFDGIVIDRLWVGHSNFWQLPDMEGVPYVQTWKQVGIKRGALTLIFVPVAAISAGLLVLLGMLF